MDLMDIYDDLDDFHQNEEKKSKELQALETKYEEALKTIEAMKLEKKDLRKKIRIMEQNLQSLLDTAKAEIKRKEKMIEDLRREKDDICFRRQKVQVLSAKKDEPVASNTMINSCRISGFAQKEVNSQRKISQDVIKEESGMQNAKEIKAHVQNDLTNENKDRFENQFEQSHKVSKVVDHTIHKSSDHVMNVYTKESVGNNSFKYLNMTHGPFVDNVKLSSTDSSASKNTDYAKSSFLPSQSCDKQHKFVDSIDHSSNKGNMERKDSRRSKSKDRYDKERKAELGSYRSDRKYHKDDRDFSTGNRSRRDIKEKRYDDAKSRSRSSDRDRDKKDFKRHKMDSSNYSSSQYYRSQRDCAKNNRRDFFDDSQKYTEHHENKSRKREDAKEKERYDQKHTETRQRREDAHRSSTREVSSTKPPQSHEKFDSKNCQKIHRELNAENNRKKSSDESKNLKRLRSVERCDSDERSRSKNRKEQRDDDERLHRTAEDFFDDSNKCTKHHENKSRNREDEKERERYDHKHTGTSQRREDPHRSSTREVSSTKPLQSLEKFDSKNCQNIHRELNAENNRKKSLDESKNLKRPRSVERCDSDERSRSKNRKEQLDDDERLYRTAEVLRHQLKMLATSEDESDLGVKNLKAANVQKTSLDFKTDVNSEKTTCQTVKIISPNLDGDMKLVSELTTATSNDNLKGSFLNDQKYSRTSAKINSTHCKINKTAKTHTDENSNFSNILNTPKNIALFEKIFGASPKRTEQKINEADELLTNVEEILEKCAGNTTTNPCDNNNVLSDISKKAVDSGESMVLTTKPSSSVKSNKDVILQQASVGNCDFDCDTLATCLPMQVINISDQVCNSPSSVISINSSIATQDSKLIIVDSPNKAKKCLQEQHLTININYSEKNSQCTNERKSKDACLAEEDKYPENVKINDQQVCNVTSTSTLFDKPETQSIKPTAAAADAEIEDKLKTDLVGETLTDDDSITGLIDDVTASIVADVKTSNYAKVAPSTSNDEPTSQLNLHHNIERNTNDFIVIGNVNETDELVKAAIKADYKTSTEKVAAKETPAKPLKNSEDKPEISTQIIKSEREIYPSTALENLKINKTANATALNGRTSISAIVCEQHTTQAMMDKSRVSDLEEAKKNTIFSEQPPNTVETGIASNKSEEHIVPLDKYTKAVTMQECVATIEESIAKSGDMSTTITIVNDDVLAVSPNNNVSTKITSTNSDNIQSTIQNAGTTDIMITLDINEKDEIDQDKAQSKICKDTVLTITDDIVPNEQDISRETVKNLQQIQKAANETCEKKEVLAEQILMAGPNEKNQDDEIKISTAIQSVAESKDIFNKTSEVNKDEKNESKKLTENNKNAQHKKQTIEASVKPTTVKPTIFDKAEKRFKNDKSEIRILQEEQQQEELNENLCSPLFYHASSDESSSDQIPLSKLQCQTKVEIIENIRLPSLFKVKSPRGKSKRNNETKMAIKSKCNLETKVVKATDTNTFPKSTKAMTTGKIDLIKPYSSLQLNLISSKAASDMLPKTNFNGEVNVEVMTAAAEEQPTLTNNEPPITDEVINNSHNNDNATTLETPNETHQECNNYDYNEASTSNMASNNETSSTTKQQSSSPKTPTNKNCKQKTPQKSYIKLDMAKTLKSKEPKRSSRPTKKQAAKPTVKLQRCTRSSTKAQAKSETIAEFVAITSPQTSLPTLSLASDDALTEQFDFKKPKLNTSNDFKAMFTAETSPLSQSQTNQIILNDAKFVDIDKNMQALFQSPIRMQTETTAMNEINDIFNETGTETAADDDDAEDRERRELELAVSSILPSDTSSANTTFECKNSPSPENSFEAKRLSLGASEYLVERVSENVVNIFITRKRRKKQRKSDIKQT